VSELELAARALAQLEGDEAQATVVRERSLATRFARSSPTQATAVEETTVELLCVRDGHTGSARTNRLDDDGLRAAAQRARDATAAAARSGPGEYPGLPSPGPPAGARAFDADTAELDPRRAATALEAAFGGCGRQGVEAFGLWTSGAVTTAIASSRGAALEQAVTDAHLKVIARDAQGRSGFASATAVAAAEIDPEAVVAQALARRATGALAELGPGQHPVVLDHAAVATLLDFLALLAFNGLWHEEGRGALSGRLGEAVAAPCVTIADDPAAAGTFARAFDAEGVAKRALTLIGDGVAQAVVHDTRSAARTGAASTGHALAAGGDPDGAVPTNLVMSGGAASSLEELCAPVERGILVTRLWYVNTVEPRDAVLTGMTRDGTFLIEDGRVAGPLHDVRFTDSVLRILAETQELTDERRLVSEADLYGERFAVGTLCPALRAGGFRVTGSA
jgi:predicted Zn-dependent protease